MSLRGTIRRSDRGPLGTEDDVKRCLSDAFPGVRFAYQAEPPPGLAQVKMPLLLRVWLFVFSAETPYPHYRGYFEPGNGGAVEFLFPAKGAGILDNGNLVWNDGRIR